MFRLLQVDASDPQQLANELQQQLQGQTADLLIASGNVASMAMLAELPHPTQFSRNWIACSSCLGAASSLGVDQATDRRLSLLAITDPKGSYGVASIEQDPAQIRQQAAATVLAAIDNAGRQAELPALIWCMQAPGIEEQIILGIQQVVGDQVPILGGSAADDDVGGHWNQFDGQQLGHNLLVIAVLYPHVPISSYFSSGYSKADYSGLITAVTGRRIVEIDHQPALQVYNRWLEQAGLAAMQPGVVMSESTFHPIGRQLAAQDIPFSLLSLPTSVAADGSIELLAELQPGDQISLMQGSKEQLVRRAAHVVRVATNNLRLQYDAEPAAALIVYCAGCMLAVRDQIAEVQQSLTESLPGIPYLVAFTFGEQGCFADGFNRHGNLMISAVIFGQPAQESQR
ncbi:MAG: FIST signal transduction protein [Rheinheimera sp.]